MAVVIMVGLSECVRVPPADSITSGPSIDKVVRRVKCDLVSALAPYLNDERYTWLQTWTAQASLTFIVNDVSTLTPGATFIQPLTTESLPLRVTNAPRSWNLGVGGEFNTTASRNETVTFSMSLQEIKDEHQSDPGSGFCDYPDLTDIHSELGLNEWLHSALSPTGNNFEGVQYLSPGHHKTSASKSSAGSSSSSSSSSGGAGAQAAGGNPSPLAVAYTIPQTRAAYTTAITKFLHVIGPPRVILTQHCESADRAKSWKTRLANLDCDFQKKLDHLAKYEIDDPTTVVTTSVSGITPSQGSSLGGTHVMIIGNNFDNLDAANAVTIGGFPARVTERPNDSTICAITPPHAVTPSGQAADVVVNASGGAGTKTGAFTYEDGTQIISFSPQSGRTDRNTQVVVSGTDFTNATGVTIGGQSLKNIVIVTNTKPNTISGILEVTAPTHPPGVVEVVVNTQNGGLTAPSPFTYYAYDPKASNGGAPSSCPTQASSKKKIIAYVDADLDKVVDQALFISRELVRLIEVCRHDRSCPYDTPELNPLLQKTKALQDSILGLELDPPLDAIGHQVQFVIASQASVSPSWTLLHFKGPTPGSGSGASVTATLTHTLNIAMGPPSSADVANTLGALQLGTAIGNSLGVSGAVSGITIPP